MADGQLGFRLRVAGQFWLWTGRIYLGLCSVAIGLFLVLAALTPIRTPPLIFLNIGTALGMAFCGLLSVYANRPEAAVAHINDLRRRWCQTTQANSPTSSSPSSDD